MRRLDVIAALLVATASSAIVTWWGIRHAFPEPKAYPTLVQVSGGKWMQLNGDTWEPFDGKPRNGLAKWVSGAPRCLR